MKNYADKAKFLVYLPEAHLLPALEALKGYEDIIEIGAQGVHFEDVEQGSNFGAFTSVRPAASLLALGVKSVLIGHCEERRLLANILKQAGVTSPTAVNQLLNRSIKCAQARGLSVTYCIGEALEDRPIYESVLGEQLDVGLQGVRKENVIIAYEPIWAIGPGKTPPGKEAIQTTASFIQEKSDQMPIIYGGGLSEKNAAMLASIDEISGGLIALTRFQGEIGFYPEEYLEIIRIYLGK